jgi:carbon storage regulator CsrA
MLVLSRKFGERIQIGERITIAVVGVRGNKVQLGIEAPQDVRVVRAELARDAAGEPGEPADVPSSQTCRAQQWLPTARLREA